ncbi:MAG TPA: hypothetical protein VFX35_07950 [Solirubrobacterales bacterium]|nr:hypothetical protein [Solirubrobacterales bacterium]
MPAGAAAKADSSFSFGERYAEAHLAGTHGYRITIHATSENLMVTARRGTASVTYFVFRKKLEGDRIDARLPGVGRVFLRFHERKRSRTRAPGNCPGSDGLTRKGVFVGLVKIRGDRDYTRAESRHVRGEIVREPRDKCRREATARASSADSEMISASTSRGRGFLSFFAFTMPSTRLRSNPLFGASLFRFRGGMAIAESQVAISKDPATLEIATPPRSATVDPPGPFTGKATFQQEAKDQFSWTGDLAVEMPGIGEVRLAGPKFETALCLGQRCRGDEDESEGTTTIAVLLPRAAAPTPSPWRWPGSPR